MIASTAIYVNDVEKRHYPKVKKVIDILKGTTTMDALTIIYTVEGYIKNGKHPLKQSAEDFIKQIEKYKKD